MNALEQLKQRLPEPRVAQQKRWLAAISVLLVVLVIWASVSQLDEQVRALGVVIPSSRSQVIQVVDAGTLKELRVKEGDAVKRGDLLAQLDPTRYQASNDEIASKAAALQANIDRLESELNGSPLVFSERVQAYPELIATQQELALKRRQAQNEEISALNQSQRLAQQELNALQRLQQTGDTSLTEVLRARRQVNELRAQANNKRNLFRQEAQTELSKARAEFDQTVQVLTQRTEAVEATFLRAPMDGVVKNVRFTTLGAVLKSGDELMQIVPSKDPLVIEAKVMPKDVGFLVNQLKAQVKLDAYDYSRYGMLTGRVIFISADTINDQLARDEQPYYRVHIQTDAPPPRLAALDIRPGMTAQVDILTGQRSVLSYLLKPLRRGWDNALHEP